MHNKKGSLNTGDGLLNIALFSLVFSFIGIIYISTAVLSYGLANDYIFYEMQNLTEELEQSGHVSSGTSDLTQTFGDDFREFNFNLDNLWFISYILFIGGSLTIAYKARKQNYFSFLGLLFYGIMLFLFLLTIFQTITLWWKNEILMSIIPTLNILVPKFYFYLDNLGLFSGIHLVLCFLINMLNFDYAKIFNRKKQELVAMEQDNEML